MPRLEWSLENRNLVGSLIGLPYKPLGDTREGVHCTGLVVLFFRELGLPCDHPLHGTAEAVLAADGTRKHFCEVKPPPQFGDVVWMRGFRLDDPAGHLGIYTPQGVLHVLEHVGVIISQRWQVSGRVRGYFRHRDLM